jgi:glycosyltransferase involved in cell wall biosynthesis
MDYRITTDDLHGVNVFDIIGSNGRFLDSSNVLNSERGVVLISPIKIVGISPEHSGIWNYSHYLKKYLKEEVEFIELFDQYKGQVKRAQALLKGIKIDDCDILILTSPLLAKSLNKCNAKTKAVIVHDLYPLNHKDSLPVKMLTKNIYPHLNDADYLFPVSEFTKQDIINQLKIDKKKIITINGGIEHEKYNTFTDTKTALRTLLNLPDGNLFLHVGRDDKRKNFRFVLELFNKLQVPNKKLIKVGTISEDDWCYIGENELDRDIIVFEDVKDERLNEIYNACDLFLFPSHYEGLGLPPIEAAACGLPVISGNQTALKESCIKESQTPLDLNKWEKKVMKILSDKPYRKKMIEEGIEHAKEFCWKKYAEQIREKLK